MPSPITEQARSYVFDILRKTEKYPYHNPSHTAGVYTRASYLATMEGVIGEDYEDLGLACLFHDTGFIEQYSRNEPIGAAIARRWLENHHHDEMRIQKIERMILATALFSKPNNLLEEIIQDADLDNIGTKEEFFYSQHLLQEMRTVGKKEISDCDYWGFVYTLLTKYKFHTPTARKEREEQLARDIEHMEKFLSMMQCPVPQPTT